MARYRLAILIPALNEARTIREVVAGARIYGRVIVIDNGSTDRTAQFARQAGAEVLRLLHPGYDAALELGFSHASAQGFDRVLTMDADGQHDPADIPRFMSTLEEGHVLVCGVRLGAIRLAEHLFAAICRRHWDIRDPWCGMKSYRMALYRQRGRFDTCHSIGTELLLFAARTGMCIGQTEITVRSRADRPRFGSILRANLTLFLAMLRVLFATRSADG